MATIRMSDISREYSEFLRRQDRRVGRHSDFDGPDPFDKETDHDDEEIDDYALYRLGVK